MAACVPGRSSFARSSRASPRERCAWHIFRVRRFPSAADRGRPESGLPLHVARQPRRGRDERLGRSGPGRCRADRGQADAGGDRDPLQAARRHRRLRPGARHARPRRASWRQSGCCAPTFGGINLKDLARPGRAPGIYDRLRDALDIPVFHENLYSTAVVAAAALSNALGAGGEGDLPPSAWSSAGPERSGSAAPVCSFDSASIREPPRLRRTRAHPSRSGRPHRVPARLRRGERARARWARVCGARTSSSAPPPAGSSPRRWSGSMARFPIVFALATPEPEIGYEEARASRRDVIVATSLGEHPNAVVRSSELPLRLPWRARRPGDPDHRGNAAGRGPLARGPCPRGCRRGGEPRLRRRAFQLRSGVPPPQTRSIRGSSCGSQRPSRHRRSPKGWPGDPWRSRPTRRASRVRLGTGRETHASADPQGAARAQARRLPRGNQRGRSCAPVTSSRTRESRPRSCSGARTRSGPRSQRLGVDLGGITIVDPARSPRYEAYVDEYFRPAAPPRGHRRVGADSRGCGRSTSAR